MDDSVIYHIFVPDFLYGTYLRLHVYVSVCAHLCFDR